MKEILLTLIIILSSINLFSQEVDSLNIETYTESIVYMKENLPQYFTQNGDTIGILLTVKQVQELDNQTDLLNLYKKMDFNCDSLNTYYLGVIDEQDNKIYIQEVQIANLKSQISNQNTMINNLKKQVANKILELDLATQQLDNKDEIIDGLKKDLKKANTQKIIGWSATGLTAAAVVVLGIFFGTR